MQCSAGMNTCLYGSGAIKGETVYMRFCGANTGNECIDSDVNVPGEGTVRFRK